MSDQLSDVKGGGSNPLRGAPGRRSRSARPERVLGCGVSMWLAIEFDDAIASIDDRTTN